MIGAIKASIGHETTPQKLKAGVDPYPDWIIKKPRGELFVVEGIMADMTYYDEGHKWKAYLSPDELKSYHDSEASLGAFADVQHRGENSRVGEIIGQKMDTVTITVDGKPVQKDVLLQAVDVTKHDAIKDIELGHYNGISSYWNYKPNQHEDGLVRMTDLSYDGYLGAVSFVRDPQASLGIRQFWEIPR